MHHKPILLQWEGALELVWTSQASASVPRMSGVSATPSRVVQCLQGARLLVAPLPALNEPRPAERTFSGLAELLQQAGVGVLPIFAAAKDKQVWAFADLHCACTSSFHYSAGSPAGRLRACYTGRATGAAHPLIPLPGP